LDGASEQRILPARTTELRPLKISFPRQHLECQRRLFDFKLLKFEVKLLKFELKLPEFEFKFLKFEFKLPEFEVKLPEFEFKFLKFEVKLPEFEVKLPGFEVKLPGFEVKLPGFEVKLPGFELKLPGFEGRKRTALEPSIRVICQRPAMIRSIRHSEIIPPILLYDKGVAPLPVPRGSWRTNGRLRPL
jgi:hypothetical protein